MRANQEVEYYFKRFGFCPRQIQEPPADDLGLVVVIPCFDEPNLNDALEALHRCEPPPCAVEVIVIINAPENCSPEVKRRNETTLHQVLDWIASNQKPNFQVRALHFPNLPRKHAGVGLARKIGMDEALRRFDRVHKLREGVIVCFDADCRCDPNYLRAIERHFREHPDSPGAAIYYEHPLQDEPPEVCAAAAQYELHLRYYVRAMRYCGLPYAFHTIGSCMAVRPDAYFKQGGMNRRKAGEDFYFLHKIIALGGFTEIKTTRVLPSPRLSHRVPFGTGNAVKKMLAAGTKEFLTYSLASFQNLKQGLQAIPDFYSGVALHEARLPVSFTEFLNRFPFENKLREIKEHTSSFEAFQKRFFRWFDAFKTMKFLHFARDHFYPDAAVQKEAAELYAIYFSDPPSPSGRPVLEWLQRYRQWDRDSAESDEKASSNP